MGGLSAATLRLVVATYMYYKDFFQLLSLLPAPPPTIPSKNPGENTAVNRSTRFDCASTVILENFAGKIFSEVGSIQKLNVLKHIAYRKNTETKKKSYSNNTPTEKKFIAAKCRTNSPFLIT